MNPEQERLLRAWLAARDPGDASAALHIAVARVPEEVDLGVAPLRALIDRVAWAGRPRPAWVLAVLVLLLAMVLVVGAGWLIRTFDTTPRFPPPGLIAYGALDQEIWVVNTDGSGARAITHTPEGEVDPRWSPDGRTLLFTRLIGAAPPDSCVSFASSALVLFDLATSTERVLVSSDGYLFDSSWSTDGRHIAFLDFDTAGCFIGDAPRSRSGGLIDVASGAVLSIAAASGSTWLGWSQGSLALVFDDHAGFADVSPGSDVRLHDVLSFDGPHWGVVSEDGRFVALSRGQRDLSGHLVLVDRTTGKRVDLGAGGAGSWSPDGGSIAFLGPESATGQAGSRPLMVASGPDWRAKPLFTIVVPPLAQGQLVQNVPDLSWTSDGRTLYWLDGDGGHAVDVATGEIADLPSVLQGCVDLQWQPQRSP